MRKGIYTATVALVALVLAISMIAINGQTAALKLEGGYSNSALEVKREWQNTWNLFDKATSDALADTIQVDCSYDGTRARNNIEDYFDSILSGFDNRCSMGAIDLPAAAGSEELILVRVNNLICSRQFGDEFSVEYSKSPVFEKIIEFSGASPACNIKITDAQSGIVEARVEVGGEIG